MIDSPPDNSTENVAAATLTFTFSGGVAADALLYNAAMQVRISTTPPINPTGQFVPHISEEGHSLGFIGSDGGVSVSLTTGGASLTGGSIPIVINTGTPDEGQKDGLIRIYITVPVYAHSSVAGSNGVDALTWYIRGGLNNQQADVGSQSVGGSILIGIGTISPDTGIIIDGGY